MLGTNLVLKLIGWGWAKGVCGLGAWGQGLTIVKGKFYIFSPFIYE